MNERVTLPSKPKAAGKVFAWGNLTRSKLREVAATGTVIVPLGAVEQHGPFLPTGTDFILSSTAVELSAAVAAEKAGHDFVVASFLRIGSSDHHLPFGGTISLPPSTFLLVLTDALKSMQHSGVKRIIMINGHGGNTGVCHAAAAAVSTATDMTVAVLDYWDYAPLAAGDFPIPGHAGRWETSLVLATRTELVEKPSRRNVSNNAKAPGRGVYGKEIWASIDGYTDEPLDASVAEGQDVWKHIADKLSTKLHELVSVM
jgi:creatinine amidohydrolase